MMNRFRQWPTAPIDSVVKGGEDITSAWNQRKDIFMNVEIRDNKLCIEIDLETPTPSSSGKTLVVASTRGNAVTTAMINDKPVIIGLNAYIKP
jgi:hypothetical protein